MSVSGAPIYERKAELFRSLGHPVRIRVLELLCERDHAVHELLGHIEVEPSNLSQQLAVLRRTGLVRQHRVGGEVVYSVGRAREVRDLLLAARRVLRRPRRRRTQLEPALAEPARRRAMNPVAVCASCVARAAGSPSRRRPTGPTAAARRRASAAAACRCATSTRGPATAARSRWAPAFGPVYDAERYGARLVASPRHADVVLVTGVVTRNMVEPLRRTVEATPTPRLRPRGRRLRPRAAGSSPAATASPGAVERRRRRGPRRAGLPAGARRDRRGPAPGDRPVTPAEVGPAGAQLVLAVARRDRRRGRGADRVRASPVAGSATAALGVAGARHRRRGAGRRPGPDRASTPALPGSARWCWARTGSGGLFMAVAGCVGAVVARLRASATSTARPRRRTAWAAYASFLLGLQLVPCRRRRRVVPARLGADGGRPRPCSCWPSTPAC